MKTIKDIQLALADWRNERDIEVVSQRAGLISNLLEEIVELMRANSAENQIDALCDMSVFLFNTLDETINLDVQNIEIKESMQNFFIECVLELSKADNFEKDLYERLLSGIVHFVNFLGFNYFECMSETIKEINSRKGEYDNTINKWVKYKGAYSLQEAEVLTNSNHNNEDEHFWYFNSGDKICKWYKADYLNAKVEK